MVVYKYIESEAIKMAIKRLPDMRLNDVSRKLRKLGYEEIRSNKHHVFANGSKRIVLTCTCKSGVQLVVLMKELKKNGISIDEFKEV
jgi:predicted RNA binding protein YcfA (HicA-like mRNA interferase family)